MVIRTEHVFLFLLTVCFLFIVQSAAIAGMELGINTDTCLPAIDWHSSCL
jgi:hypothetical protein